MKKVLLGLFALSTMAMAQNYFDGNNNLYLKAGFDIAEKYDVISSGEIDANDSKSDDLGFELAAEFTRDFMSNLELGLGIAYQEHGEPKDKKYYDWLKISAPGYSSIPLYFVGKYNFKIKSDIKTFIKFNLGYSFNDIDGEFVRNADIQPLYNDISKASAKVEDGMYLGIGAGFEINNFVTELDYKTNKAEISSEGNKFGYDYSRVTLSFGYKFNF